jgi:hypothetical protein
MRARRVFACRGVSRWSFAAGARRRVKELARAAAAVTLFFFSQKKSSQKGQAFKNSSQYFSHAICKECNIVRGSSSGYRNTNIPSNILSTVQIHDTESEN